MTVVLRTAMLMSILCLAAAPIPAQYLPVTRMGIVSALHDYWCDPAKHCGDGNYEDAVDIANISYHIGEPGARGFRAIKLWPKKYGYLSQDMMDIYKYLVEYSFCTGEGCWDPTEFDVIAVRPLQNSSVVTEVGCDGKTYSYFRWENIDYGEVATDLYQAIGHLDKTIILTGWEADNQIKGLGCPDRIPSAAEEQNLIDMLDARQSGIRAAREANLGEALRIYHAVEVSHVLSSAYRVIDEIVPRLAETPDLISFSAWTTNLGSVKMTDALNHIVSVTGLPRDRIFIGEYGAHESPWNDPYWQVYTRFRDAFNWGVKLGFFWNYRDHFTCPKSGGTWLRRCDESVSNNYAPCRDLRDRYDS